MENFSLHMPTRIFFGTGHEEKIGSLLKRFGVSEVLLHYGGGSIKASGLYDKITASLRAAKIHCTELGGVRPNPVLSTVREGIALCRERGVQFILAVGGGSVIDSAKAIAAGVPYDGDVWDFFYPMPKKRIEKMLRVATVLTIPAAGSEMSDSCVITNEDGNLKRSFSTDLCRPVFSVLNPENTRTLPKYQLACGITDMLAHVFERYFTNSREVELTDRLCEAVMQTVIFNAQRALDAEFDYEAAANLMWASSLAHNGLLGAGRVGDWASHGIEHELSAKYGVAHGEGLAIVLPGWMRYVYKHDVTRFARFASKVWGFEMNINDLEGLAADGINATAEFFKAIGMRSKISELGGTAEDIPYLAAHTALVPPAMTIGNFVPLTETDVSNILNSVL
ncbi:MAG: iron-containing alcohol dehydrogenase [Clostridiaceae bacterium]|jgi:alcohol dehydrogenase YqhD (iron-dependent ADH family)|nr:iron-containing alcohol dehydrogenase [Clostridiaceae bacterium]